MQIRTGEEPGSRRGGGEMPADTSEAHGPGSLSAAVITNFISTRKWA